MLNNQLVLSEKCRDSEDFRVMEDSLSQVIYLDWDKKDHSINYEETRNSNYSFYYEDFINSEERIKELLPLIGSKKVLDFGNRLVPLLDLGPLGPRLERLI